MRFTLWLGRLQAAFAADFRSGGVALKVWVFPSWLVTRLAFRVAFPIACWRLERRVP